MFRHRRAVFFSFLISMAHSFYGYKGEGTTQITTSPKQLAKPVSSPLLVFGILTQPFYTNESSAHAEHYDHGYRYEHDYNHTYVAASYVKWLEDGGARSIPIPFDASPYLVKEILSQVDGVLFPGGASSLPTSVIAIWDQLHSAKYYYPAEHDAPGDRIPLWGTCLGMEFIIQLAACTNEDECGCSYNQSILEKGYDSTNISLPLMNVDRTGLYQPEIIYDIATGYNVTMNNHHLGISPETFRRNSGLSSRFDVTSMNYDRNGKAFVSTIEPYKRKKTESYASLLASVLQPPPVYGVQYHPEKNTHEYGYYPHTTVPYESIDHSPEGVTFSVYEATFLVNLARDNILNRMQPTRTGDEHSQNYTDAKYNKPDIYPMIYTYPRRVGYKFEERHIIPPASHWERNMNQNNRCTGEKEKNFETIDREASSSMLRRKPMVPQQRL